MHWLWLLLFFLSTKMAACLFFSFFFIIVAVLLCSYSQSVSVPFISQIIAYFFDRNANKSNAMIELIYVALWCLYFIHEEDSYESIEYERKASWHHSDHWSHTHMQQTLQILTHNEKKNIHTLIRRLLNMHVNVPMSDFNRSFNFKASDFDLWFCFFFWPYIFIFLACSRSLHSLLLLFCLPEFLAFFLCKNLFTVLFLSKINLHDDLSCSLVFLFFFLKGFINLKSEPPKTIHKKMISYAKCWQNASRNAQKWCCFYTKRRKRNTYTLTEKKHTKLYTFV